MRKQAIGKPEVIYTIKNSTPVEAPIRRMN